MSPVLYSTVVYYPLLYHILSYTKLFNKFLSYTIPAYSYTLLSTPIPYCYILCWIYTAESLQDRKQTPNLNNVFWQFGSCTIVTHPWRPRQLAYCPLSIPKPRQQAGYCWNIGLCERPSDWHWVGSNRTLKLSQRLYGAWRLRSLSHPLFSL